MMDQAQSSGTGVDGFANFDEGNDGFMVGTPAPESFDNSASMSAAQDFSAMQQPASLGMGVQMS